MRPLLTLGRLDAGSPALLGKEVSLAMERHWPGRTIASAPAAGDPAQPSTYVPRASTIVICRAGSLTACPTLVRRSNVLALNCGPYVGNAEMNGWAYQY